MLRPSRPMMRPFSSSDLSSTTDTVVSTAWLDATRCITAARMLRARRSASRRVSSSTWRISRALSWRSSSSSSRIMICFAWPALRPASRSSSRSWSRLASFSSSRAWSRLRWRSSSERSRSASSWRLEVERALPGAQALLEPRELRAAHLQLVLESSLRPPSAPPASAPALSALRTRTGAPLAACAARGRCTSSATDTATAAATSAANTISIRCLPLSRRRARRPHRFRAARLGAARHQLVLQKRRARRSGARESALWTLPNAPSEPVRWGHCPHEKKLICWSFVSRRPERPLSHEGSPGPGWCATRAGRRRVAARRALVAPHGLVGELGS